jgi:ADP-ribose pyrophosphatase YjhB (NUDIX family)
VEGGETLAQALVREMAEETGADVAVGRLLYVCDHVPAALVHVTFEVRRIGGALGPYSAGRRSSAPLQRVDVEQVEDFEL